MFYFAYTQSSWNIPKPHVTLLLRLVTGDLFVYNLSWKGISNIFGYIFFLKFIKNIVKSISSYSLAWTALLRFDHGNKALSLFTSTTHKTWWCHARDARVSVKRKLIRWNRFPSKQVTIRYIHYMSVDEYLIEKCLYCLHPYFLFSHHIGNNIIKIVSIINNSSSVDDHRLSSTHLASGKTLLLKPHDRSLVHTKSNMPSCWFHMLDNVFLMQFSITHFPSNR